MTTDPNGIFDQDSEVSTGNDAASSYERSVLPSHIRACTSCVRAKAKCSTIVEIGKKCERCRRMNKVCQPSPPVRKRRTLKRPSADVTSKLEEKLDGLVTLIKSATQGLPVNINAASDNSPPEGSIPSNYDSAYDSIAVGIIGNQDYAYNRPLDKGRGLSEPEVTTTASFDGSTSFDLQPFLHPALEPTTEDAESYLNRFRTDLVKYFPFIVISPSMTAHELRQQRPMLWTCIMTVASSSSTQQIGLSKEVRRILGQEAFVKGTRNMDLLLAILVYSAWDRRHFFEGSILVGLVQFAIAILYDLRLNKPPVMDPALILACGLKGIGDTSKLSKARTIEERRALLGCFLMSSICSSYLRRGDVLRWTAYSDECLRVIESEEQSASDVLLIQLVKLRLIHGRVSDTPWSSAMADLENAMKPPSMFYLKSLEAQLHDFKSNIPSELVDNKALLLELYYTEFSIYEIGFSQAPGVFSAQYNQRIECLCACVNAVKSWIDVFLSILPADYVGFSTSVYSSMACCFICICRLWTFEHPEWDRGLIRGDMDISLFIEEAEKNFAQVKEMAGLDLGGSEDMDFFSVMASKLRAIKISWDALSGFSAASGAAPNDELCDFPMEFIDDDWLRDLLGT